MDVTVLEPFDVLLTVQSCYTLSSQVVKAKCSTV